MQIKPIFIIENVKITASAQLMARPMQSFICWQVGVRQTGLAQPSFSPKKILKSSYD